MWDEKLKKWVNLDADDEVSYLLSDLAMLHGVCIYCRKILVLQLHPAIQS